MARQRDRFGAQDAVWERRVWIGLGKGGREGDVSDREAASSPYSTASPPASLVLRRGLK